MEEAAQRGVMIEVIDETAVIDTTSTPVCEDSEGNNSVDSSSNNVVKQETDGKKEKRNRRRRKGGRKFVGTDGQETRLVDTAHVQNGFSKKAERTYSREEIEALRFVNLEAQQTKWVEVYCGLGPNVARDYDGLIDSNNQNHIQINFDPRQQYGKKEKKIHGVLGDDTSCSQVMDDEIGNINPLDPACDLSVGVEGQCGEEDDSDEDYCGIQKLAFFVTGEPNFDAGPPEDGLEYLRRVRWEAARVPKVKVANLERSKLNKEQTVYMPIIPDIEKCPEHLLPMKQWEDAFMAYFSELRLAVSRLEDSHAEISAQYPLSSTIHPEESSIQLPETIFTGSFDKLINGGDEPSEALDFSTPESPDYPQPAPSMDESNACPSLVNASSKTTECGSSSDSPTLSAVLAMDFKARLSMLRRRIRLAEDMTTLSRNDCAWLFALCTAIDTPLDADTCAALRCLLRKCASLRAGKLVLDDEVAMLNILATITGKYFGQSEF